MEKIDKIDKIISALRFERLKVSRNGSLLLTVHTYIPLENNSSENETSTNIEPNSTVI